jgi:hypothetical protein
MTTQHKEDRSVRDYLLGQLTKQDAAAIEERYFLDRAFLASVEAVEKRLIRDYLDNRLSAADRETFESQYTTLPALRKKLAAARVERAERGTGQAPAGLAGIWRLAVVCLVLLAAIGAWMYMRDRRTPVPLEARNSPPAGRAIDLEMSPGLLKDARGAVRELTLPLDAPAVRFTLELIGECPAGGCDASLSVVGDDGRWQRVWASSARLASVRRDRNSSVVVEVPSSIFQRGDYVMQLTKSESEVLASYPLSVADRR